MSRKYYYQMFWLDRAMMGCDMAHAGIIDVASFVRDDTWPVPKFYRQEADTSDCYPC
jgi:oligoribonuclease (3'-5' exoribonuclease)